MKQHYFCIIIAIDCDNESCSSDESEVADVSAKKSS
jgi:hypothetical protein